VEGRLDEALAEVLLALKLLEKQVGPENAMLASLLVDAAGVRRKLAGPAAALPELERALAILAKADAGPAVAGNVRWELARALTDTRRDPARARGLASEAEASYRQAKDEARAAEVAAWLAGRR
jgi:hypothetical protein